MSKGHNSQDQLIYDTLLELVRCKDVHQNLWPLGIVNLTFLCFYSTISELQNEDNLQDILPNCEMSTTHVSNPLLIWSHVSLLWQPSTQHCAWHTSKMHQHFSDDLRRTNKSPWSPLTHQPPSAGAPCSSRAASATLPLFLSSDLSWADIMSLNTFFIPRC